MKNEFNNQVNAIETTVANLQSQIAEVITALDTLKTAVANHKEQEDKKYSFTEEQMVKLFRRIEEATISRVADAIRDSNIDCEDYVEFKWNTYGNTAEAELDIDNDSIVTEFAEWVDNTDTSTAADAIEFVNANYHNVWGATESAE